MVRNYLRPFSIFIGLFTVLLSLLVVTPIFAQADSTPPPGSYYYTVKPGDTWNIVSQRTGISVTELMAANPQAVHPNSWLWLNERLLIPAKPLAKGYWYQVRPGDTWNTVAKATGVSVRDLWQANPDLLNKQRWLFIGQRVWIPAAPPSAASVETATPAATAGASPAAPPVAAATPAAPEATATPAATSAPAATATPAATSALAATSAPAATAIVPPASPTPSTAAAAPLPTPAKPAATVRPGTAQGCPAQFAGYSDAILARLNTPGYTADSLRAWLVGCGALDEVQGGITKAPLQSPTSADLVVTVKNPTNRFADGESVLLVFHAGPRGYTLARTVQGSGQLTLLRAGDVNADGRGDLVWSDATCGAHTCFSALSVESWDGKAYQDWLAGAPAMASAEYAFKNAGAAGTGDAIIVHGGVIGSTGAGPQRAWTETYTSVNGAPYTLVSQVYDKSSCLYHAILDANAAFGEWATHGFEPAIAAYQAAISDKSLKACSSLADEVAVLQDFARFRLLMADVAGGMSGQADGLAKQMTQKPLQGVARAFLDSYRKSGSIIQACRDVTTYAKANPDSWQFLADWGYANPAFGPEDLCPLQ